jgi:hypothetical protein
VFCLITCLEEHVHTSLLEPERRSRFSRDLPPDFAALPDEYQPEESVPGSGDILLDFVSEPSPDCLRLGRRSNAADDALRLFAPEEPREVPDPIPVEDPLMQFPQEVRPRTNAASNRVNDALREFAAEMPRPPSTPRVKPAPVASSPAGQLARWWRRVPVRSPTPNRLWEWRRSARRFLGSLGNWWQAAVATTAIAGIVFAATLLPDPAAVNGTTAAASPGAAKDLSRELPGRRLPPTPVNAVSQQGNAARPVREPSPPGPTAGPAGRELRPPVRRTPAARSAAPDSFAKPASKVAAAAPGAAAAQPPGKVFRGSVSFESNPAGARVTLNGRIVGTTPLVLGDLRAGSYVLLIELRDHDRWSRSVRVVADTTTVVRADLRRAR